MTVAEALALAIQRTVEADRPDLLGRLLDEMADILVHPIDPPKAAT